MNIEEEIKALQEQLDKLKAKQAEECKYKGMWTPKSLETFWYIDSIGRVCWSRYNMSDDHKKLLPFGNCFETEKQAEKASVAMRQHNRILAWLANHDDGWEADWCNRSQVKNLVCYNNATQKYSVDVFYDVSTIGAVYMSKENATELCRQLNEGEFTLLTLNILRAVHRGLGFLPSNT